MNKWKAAAKFVQVASQDEQLNYGCEMFFCKDDSSRRVQLSVSAHGLAVYSSYDRINNFPWSSIASIQYKYKLFVINKREAGAVKTSRFEMQTTGGCVVCDLG